jgi:hypothetical protein
VVCKFAVTFVELSDGLLTDTDFDLVENSCGDSYSK